MSAGNGHGDSPAANPADALMQSGALVVTFNLRLDPELARRYEGLPATVQAAIEEACSRAIKLHMAKLIHVALSDHSTAAPAPGKIILPSSRRPRG